MVYGLDTAAAVTGTVVSYDLYTSTEFEQAMSEVGETAIPSERMLPDIDPSARIPFLLPYLRYCTSSYAPPTVFSLATTHAARLGEKNEHAHFSS